MQIVRYISKQRNQRFTVQKNSKSKNFQEIHLKFSVVNLSAPMKECHNSQYRRSGKLSACSNKENDVNLSNKRNEQFKRNSSCKQADFKGKVANTSQTPFFNRPTGLNYTLGRNRLGSQISSNSINAFTVKDSDTDLKDSFGYKTRGSNISSLIQYKDSKSVTQENARQEFYGERKYSEMKELMKFMKNIISKMDSLEGSKNGGNAGNRSRSRNGVVNRNEKGSFNTRNRSPFRNITSQKSNINHRNRYDQSVTDQDSISKESLRNSHISMRIQDFEELSHQDNNRERIYKENLKNNYQKNSENLEKIDYSKLLIPVSSLYPSNSILLDSHILILKLLEPKNDQSYKISSKGVGYIFDLYRVLGVIKQQTGSNEYLQNKSNKESFMLYRGISLTVQSDEEVFLKVSKSREMIVEEIQFQLYFYEKDIFSEGKSPKLGIQQMIDYFYANNMFHIVYKSSGITLREWITKKQEKSQFFIFRFLLFLAHSCQSLHDIDVVHHSINQDSILICPKTSKLELTNFSNSGFKNKIIKNKEKDGQYTHFHSPESIVEGRYLPSSDIWSIGCLIFELNFGISLFDYCTSYKELIFSVFYHQLQQPQMRTLFFLDQNTSYLEDTDNSVNFNRIAFLENQIEERAAIFEDLRVSNPRLHFMIREMLRVDPDQRIDCSGLIEILEDVEKVEI